MKVNYLTALAALGAFCLPAPATAEGNAAEASAQARPDSSTLAAADRLLDAMGYDRMMERTCDAMALQIGPMFKKSIEAKTGQPVDDALVQRLSEVESAFLRDALLGSPNLKKAIATLYASKFSSTELDHLAFLYKDPVMRKWTEVAPDMTAETLPLIQGVVESRRTALEAKIAATVSDYLAEKSPAPGT